MDFYLLIWAFCLQKHINLQYTEVLPPFLPPPPSPAHTTIPAYKTAQMLGRLSGRDIQTHTIPAYKTAQMSGRRSGRDKQTQNPCLQDRTDVRSPVRERYTDTHNPCLQDRTDVRSPVRERQTDTKSLPTRPHRCQVAGQGETNRHKIPAYETAQMSGRLSRRDIQTQNPCLQDRTDVRSPVRDRHTDTHNPCLQDRTNGCQGALNVYSVIHTFDCGGERPSETTGDSFGFGIAGSYIA